jgi:crotonobetainyl-CoA:carnitine CoA-transferase CaiB-like acyl-CoA transferase
MRPERGGHGSSSSSVTRFHCADGPFFVSAGNDRQFAGLVDALGEPGLAADARFVTNPDRQR